MKTPYVVPSTARRDWCIGAAVGAACVALVIYALMNLSGGLAGSTLTGKIVAKHFTPLPEERVSIGKGGLYARHSDGEYVLECLAGGRSYLITVDKQTYESKKIGNLYFFSRPAGEPPSQ